jgi:Zn-dependent protease
MKQTLRLGRFAGIPIGVHWSVFVIVAVIGAILGADALPVLVPHQPAVAYWGIAVPGAVLFVAALLAHEVAHAVVARHHGVAARSITLWALGGVAELDRDPPTPRADLQIAAAGPVTSLAAGIAFAGLAIVLRAAGGPLLAIAALAWLAFTNGLVAVFNLLPGAPLDGGRVLRALLWMRLGDRARAARAAAAAGRVIGVLLVGLGFAQLLAWEDLGGLWLALVGVFVIGAAASEAAAESSAAVLGGMRVRDVMSPDPATGEGWMTVAYFTTRVPLRPGQRAFPVLSGDGGLAGIATPGELSRVPAADRHGTELRQVMVPVPPAYLAGPDDPAGPLATRPPLAGEVAAVATCEGGVVGIVTVADLRRVTRGPELPAPSPPSTRP